MRTAWDAGEGYHAWYPPAPYRLNIARDAETEDYILHGSDPDYEARALGFDEDPARSHYEHMRQIELSNRMTDEELEQELQYELHCKEEVERNKLNCATIRDVYPSDYILPTPAEAATTDTQAVPLAKNKRTKKPQRKKSKVSKPCKPSTPPSSDYESPEDVPSPTASEEAEMDINLRCGIDDPDTTSVCYAFSVLSARMEAAGPRDRVLCPPYVPR